MAFKEVKARGGAGPDEGLRADTARLKAEAVRLYHSERLPVSQVGKRLGISATTVAEWTRNAGVTRKSRRDDRNDPRIKRLYVGGKSMAQVAECLGVSMSVIYASLKAQGVARRPGEGASLSATVRNAKNIQRASLLYGEGMPIRDIAQAMGRSFGAVQGWLKKAGIQMRSTKEARTPAPGRVAAAVQRYREGVSCEKVGREFGVSGGTVRLWVLSSGGQIRSRGQRD